MPVLQSGACEMSLAADAVNRSELYPTSISSGRVRCQFALSHRRGRNLSLGLLGFRFLLRRDLPQ